MPVRAGLEGQGWPGSGAAPAHPGHCTGAAPAAFGSVGELRIDKVITRVFLVVEPRGGIVGNRKS